MSIPSTIEIRAGKLYLEGALVPIEQIDFVKELGRGASGIVLLGHDKVLDRAVAVKIWPTNPADDRDKVVQAQHEAVKVAKFDHPNIVRVYSANATNGATFALITEHIDGIVLREYLEAQHDFSERVQIWNGIYAALEHAHARGVLHGDVHSGNVMLVNLVPKLIDFGTSYFVSKANSSSKRESKLILDLTEKIFSDGDKRLLRAIPKPASANPSTVLTHCSAWVKLEQLFSMLTRTIEEFQSEDIDGWELRNTIYGIAVQVVETPTINLDQVLVKLKFNNFPVDVMAEFVSHAAGVYEASASGDGIGRSWSTSQTDLTVLTGHLRKLHQVARDRYLGVNN